MNALKRLLFTLSTGLLLSGCATNDVTKETVMPQTQQNTYLSHAKPPQQFGFSVFPLQDGIAFNGSCRLHPNHMAGVRMVQDSIPIIKIQGARKHRSINTLIDFSSPSSWLEFSASQDLGAYFLGLNKQTIPYRGGYNTGGANAYAGVVTQLRIGQLFIENTPFFIRMASGSIGPLARGIRSPKIDAVLGYDNLRNFEYIQIDMRNNVIKFSSSIPYMPHEALLMDVAKIIKRQGYGLSVEGAIDGTPTPVILDFAGNFDFARGDMKVSITDSVTIGHLSFRQLPTLVLPINSSPPRVGRKTLAPYIITICNKEGVVYFERPPR